MTKNVRHHSTRSQTGLPRKRNNQKTYILNVSSRKIDETQGISAPVHKRAAEETNRIEKKQTTLTEKQKHTSVKIFLSAQSRFAENNSAQSIVKAVLNNETRK